MNSIWHYTILDDNTFYMMKDKGANLSDMLQYCELKQQKVSGRLF